MSYAYGKAQIQGEVKLPDHLIDQHMSEAEKKEHGLEQFYAQQQSEMEKRLEMVFRQINAKAKVDAHAPSGQLSRSRSITSPALVEPEQGKGAKGAPKPKKSESSHSMKDTIESHEIEDYLVKACKMTPKQVAACKRSPADLPVKPLDQVPYITDMIWEIDESGDGTVNFEEFKRAYERAAVDRTGFEPRKLTTLIDFLLMDEESLGYVTEEQISELMTARYGACYRTPFARLRGCLARMFAAHVGDCAPSVSRFRIFS